MEYTLVFIGFGEAAYNIAAGLKEEGFTSMAAYDNMADDPKRGELIHKRATEVGIPLITLEEAIEKGEFIASLNSAKVAYSVAFGNLSHPFCYACNIKQSLAKSGLALRCVAGYGNVSYILCTNTHKNIPFQKCCFVHIV